MLPVHLPALQVMGLEPACRRACAGCPPAADAMQCNAKASPRAHFVWVKGKLGVVGVGVAVGIVQGGPRLQLRLRPEDDGKAPRLAVLQARDGDVALPHLRAGRQEGVGRGQAGAAFVAETGVAQLTTRLP